MDFPFTKRNRISLFARFNGLDLSAVATFLDGWKDGQEGWFSLRKKGNRKSQEQLGYYYAVILPEAFKDFKESGDVVLEIWLGPDKKRKLPLTLTNVDFFFKIQYAEYNDGVYMDKADMDMTECAAFETYVIKWLMQWRNVHVPPADKDWRSK